MFIGVLGFFGEYWVIKRSTRDCRSRHSVLVLVPDLKDEMTPKSRGPIA